MEGYAQQPQRTPREEFAVPQAWYGKVLGPGPGWENQREEELVVCVCPMAPLASYIKKVVAVPPQHVNNVFLRLLIIFN